MKFSMSVQRHSRAAICRKRRCATIILTAFTALCLLASSRTFAQKVSITVKNEKLSEVIKQVTKQAGYEYIASPALLSTAHPVTVSVKKVELLAFLSEILKDQPITYSVKNKIIILIKRPETVVPNAEKLGIIPQSKDINGKITNQNGDPMAGATIKVIGTSRGTLSGADGTFHISEIGNKDVTIEVTFAGLATQTINAKPGQFVTVELAPSDNELDVVQTMAYSKTSMRYNTGTVVTVTSKDIEKNPVPNVLQAIQGRVPGMFIQQQTGQPGGAFNITVRGRGTFGNNAPLYIIDGVAYPSGTLPMNRQTTGNSYSVNPLQGGNALNYLDPSLIESVNVLEGADATAIYGSRGAYGVVIITTKRGAAGKPTFSLNTYSGISQRGTAPKLLNTQQYLMLRREAFANDGVPINPALNFIYPTDDILVYDTTSYTNWQKELTGNNAMTTKLNATYSGGTQNLSFLIGANYNNLQNVQRGKGHDRNGGMNFDIRSATPDKKLTIDLSGSFSTDVNTMVPFDFTGVNIPPDAPPIFLPDGHLNWSTGTNPASALYELYRNTTNNLISNLSIDYVPVKGLTFHVTAGYNLISAKEFTGQPSGYFNPATFTTSQTQGTLNYYSTHTLTLDPNVNYTTLLGGAKGRLSITAGGTLQDQTQDNHTITGKGFLSDALVNNPASAAQANTTVNYNLTPSRYAGYFGVINYTYDNKYILNLNGRRDGSTSFGPGKQFGNFGSIGAAWIFSDEKWFKDNIAFIDFAKLRGSYGTVGGDGIGNYQFLNTYNVNASAYQGNPGLSPARIANPYLQWESNKEDEIGITLQFLKDRITFDGDYYYRTTSNQLENQPLSSVTGFTYVLENVPTAKIQTNGFEFSLTTTNIRKRNFSWTSALNMSFPKSKLVSYPGAAQLLNVNYEIGKPVTGILLYKYDGVDPQTGVYTFTNKAGITGPFAYGSSQQLNQDSDRTVFLDLAPKFYGGLENTFAYKGFSLSCMIYFVDENGPNWLGSQTYPPGFPYNTIPEALKRWQKPGDKTSVPKVTQSILGLIAQNNFRTSTGAYSNAAFARLSNVNIAYTFSYKWLKKAGISRLQVYASGQNLLTVSKYGDIDPENLNASLMPPLRIYTGGLNISF